MKGKVSLCFRCDYRAQFLETGFRPRYECGEIKLSKISCYMYRPVKPVILLKDIEDERPQFGPAILSSRSSCQGLPEENAMVLNIMDAGKNKSILYWDKAEIKPKKKESK